jgi:hypothetical protein
VEQRTKVRTELNMATRAAKQGWDTPADKRREYVDLAKSIIDDPDAAPAYKSNASKALAAMQAAGWCAGQEPLISAKA